jgi:hypothetical protein
VLFLNPRATIGRLLTSWMFWVVFVVMVGVRIYIGTVTGDEVRYTSIIIGGFVSALAFTWGWERWMKDGATTA